VVQIPLNGKLSVVLLERERLLVEVVLLCTYLYTQGAEVVRIPLTHTHT